MCKHEHYFINVSNLFKLTNSPRVFFKVFNYLLLLLMEEVYQEEKID